MHNNGTFPRMKDHRFRLRQSVYYHPWDDPLRSVQDRDLSGLSDGKWVRSCICSDSLQGQAVSGVLLYSQPFPPDGYILNSSDRALHHLTDHIRSNRHHLQCQKGSGCVHLTIRLILRHSMLSESPVRKCYLRLWQSRNKRFHLWACSHLFWTLTYLV